jgi:hypothetical protein
MPISSTTAPLTPADLIYPRNASGYRYVSNAQSSGGTRPLWAAKKGKFVKGSAPEDWHGPCRATPKEAAQDYCDYINGQQATPATQLKSAGHAYDIEKTDNDPEVEAALGVIRDFNAQKAGRQGYVYCITDGEYVKIGYSVNPSKRVAELQTGNARILRVLGTLPGTPADERRLHEKYIEHNVLQEWFELDSDLLAEFAQEEEEATA